MAKTLMTAAWYRTLIILSCPSCNVGDYSISNLFARVSTGLTGVTLTSLLLPGLLL